MIGFRIRILGIFILMLLLAAPAFAQPAPAQSDSPSPILPDSREASFAPITAPTTGAPVTLEPQATPLLSAPGPAAETQAPVSAPASASPANIPGPPSPPIPATQAAAPAAPAEIGKPVELAEPVESGQLQNINPESIGLLSSAEGGLGAALWKGTPRELVERLLPGLLLPTPSPTLNHLAQRLLLTAANVPAGAATANQSLTAMRIEKLVALGDAKDAWRLARLAKADQIDEITLRLAGEAALLTDAGKDVCSQLPSLMQAHASAEWQKPLIVCQLRAADMKSAQLGLDVMHAQNEVDEVFFTLAEHNVIAGNKSLPRQLTPLKPVNLALLQLIGQPLPPELFMHPEAALIPTLLEAKARDATARLALAERAVARGLISGQELASVYLGTPFPAEALSNAANTSETGARLHALLYQAALQEKQPQNKLAAAVKFLQSAEPALQTGAAPVMADMIRDVTPGPEFSAYAVPATEIFALAAKPEIALSWLKIATDASASAPGIAAQLQNLWPLMTLTGLQADSDYNANLGKWLTATLTNADRVKREQAGSILLLLEAAGFAIPEDTWTQVADAAAAERRGILPPTLLFERLRAAATAGKRGETVLLSLITAGNPTGETSLLATIEAVRGLRLVGLLADAQALARENVLALLTPAKQ